MKKLLALLLVVTLLGGIFTGCGNKSASNDNQAETDDSASSSEDTATEDLPTTNPVSDEPVSFSVLWSGEFNKDYKVLAKMKELTNVSLEVEAIPDSDYDTKRDVILASGNMPDIVTKTLSNQSINELGMNGRLLAIDKYLDKLPHFMEKVEKYGWQSIITDNTAPDGHMYQLPMVVGEVKANAKQQMIRTDVFEKEGFGIPTTWEELYEDAKVLKAKYPDSYPIGVVYGLGNLIDMMAPSFGTSGGWGAGRNNFHYDTAKDEWIFAPTSNEFKTMLQFINKLYSEGLLDQEFTTMDSSVYAEKMSTNKTFFVVADWMGCEITPQTTLRETDPDASWDPIFPLAGSSGAFIGRTGWYAQGEVFSAELEKSDNFDVFLRWLDWLYTDEAIDLIAYGVEGESYTRTSEGLVKFSSDIKTAMNPEGTVDLGIVWGLTQNSFFYVAPSASKMDPSEVNKKYTDLMVLEAEKDAVPSPNPKIALTLDQLEEEKLVAVALSDYTNAMIEKFIMGSESFDNWDSFVAEANAKGAEQLKALYNDAWKVQNQK